MNKCEDPVLEVKKGVSRILCTTSLLLEYSAEYNHLFFFFEIQLFEWQGLVYTYDEVTAKKNQNTLVDHTYKLLL
jgi:hypothetical protein